MSNKSTLNKTEVTLKMLIEEGILSPGTELLCNNPEVRATLSDDGSLTVIFGGQKKKFSHLSGAARHIEDKSLNGWKYWFVKLDNEIRYLESFREQYLKC